MRRDIAYVAVAVVLLLTWLACAVTYIGWLLTSRL